jgi:glyoxylase-like metal-dependent hydrolase (beta-lactamase superfamily II)
MLPLRGRRPALVDSGSVGHAEETASWARTHAGDVGLVVNTHWHSDHVGGNALLQARGRRCAPPPGTFLPPRPPRSPGQR